MTAHPSKRYIGPAALILAAVLGLTLTAAWGNGTPGPASAAAADAKSARAKFDREKFDFGKVKQGEVLTHEFVFRNVGDDTLVVEKVETTCGCTAALASEKKIAPGKEGKIKVTFDTHGYTGRLVKYVFLESNDADDARRELSLSAEIEVPPSARIELDRYNIELGLGLQGESVSTPLVIRNIGELELSVEISHAEMSFHVGGKPVKSPLKIAAGKSVELEIRFFPTPRTGMLRDYILVRSNDPVRSTLSVYVARYIVTRQELKALFAKYGQALKDK